MFKNEFLFFFFEYNCLWVICIIQFFFYWLIILRLRIFSLKWVKTIIIWCLIKFWEFFGLVTIFFIIIIVWIAGVNSSLLNCVNLTITFVYNFLSYIIILFLLIAAIYYFLKIFADWFFILFMFGWKVFEKVLLNKSAFLNMHFMFFTFIQTRHKIIEFLVLNLITTFFIFDCKLK